MQHNLELEHQLHEYRDLIGRDVEYVISDRGFKLRFRGQIARICCEIEPDTRCKNWHFETHWMARMKNRETFPETPIGKWRMLVSPREESFFIVSAGFYFSSSELVEQADGTFVKKENIRGATVELVIHKPDDNLDLDSVSP